MYFFSSKPRRKGLYTCRKLNTELHQSTRSKGDYVLVLSHPSALLDLDGHGPGHHVTGRQVLSVGRISLHKPLSLRIAQNTALSPIGNGDECITTPRLLGLLLVTRGVSRVTIIWVTVTWNRGIHIYSTARGHSAICMVG